MPVRDETILEVVLCQNGAAKPLPAEASYGLLTALLDAGHSVVVASQPESVAGAGARPRLVLGYFDDQPIAGQTVETGSGRVFFRNVRGLAPEQVGPIVDAVRELSDAAPRGAWKPWFPVIDFDHCTNCLQCLSFCLFGVYGVDAENRIQVQNPQDCKTNCPACSRVCPEAAIIFPKYSTGPINGEAVSETDLAREKMKIDVSALLGGDVYSLLRQRSDRAKTRFSKERDADTALKERQKCLAKIIEAGSIPPEVLMALPSQEEILRRAAEARAKAEAARQRQAAPTENPNLT